MLGVVVSVSDVMAGQRSKSIYAIQFGAGFAVQSQSRPVFDGQVGGSMRGSLPLFVRRMAAEESDSARPDFVVRLRQALSGQPGLPARHAGAGGKAQSRPQCRNPEDWRLLLCL